MQRNIIRTHRTALVLALLIPSIAAYADVDAKVQSGINSAYSLTKTGFGSADRITGPGTVYVVHVDGLLGRPIANHVTPTNVVKEGALVPPAKGFIASFGASGDAQQIKPGHRFYVHEIEVKDDAVVFTLISLDQIGTVVQGHSTQSRLRLYLRFELDKKIVPTLTAESIHKLTDPFFLPEGDPGLTPTVQLGQSSADVIKLLGDPVKQINLGDKKILVYKDIKVTLVNDKVTDAQ